MLEQILKLPVFLVFVIICCAAMYLPAAHAITQQDFHVARSFFYSGTLGLILSTLIGIAILSRPVKMSALQYLLSLLAAFAFMPVLLAIPFYEALQTTSFVNAYFEMVSCLTTTGATLFDVPSRLPSALHLWRGMVGWGGGLLMWVAAAAILAPLNLGGFEVTGSAQPGQGGLRVSDMKAATPGKRLIRATERLFPIYLGLTMVLWISLLISGQSPLNGLIHAMSTLSTSGISAIGGMQFAESHMAGELLVFVFLVFAVTRLTFTTDTMTGHTRRLDLDPEFRIGLIVVIGLPLLLFTRHWVGAFDVNEEHDLLSGMTAFWGSMFTVLSFLTTTGFVSADWQSAQGWSGLSTPGMILMGLALLGGGVATTAGGVKLLRVYTLYLNGLREMERLVHPSIVSGTGDHNRHMRKQGALTAWVFFMLFALLITAFTLGLAAFGSTFQEALVLSVAALSTTGPLTQVAIETPIALAELPTASKLIFCAGMVLGRLEALAIIALITPELLRR